MICLFRLSKLLEIIALSIINHLTRFVIYSNQFPKQLVSCFLSRQCTVTMAGYFEEMGWAELQEGQQANHLLDMARFLIDYGFYNEDIIGEWPRLPPPASKETVLNLPEITIESDDKSCPICLKAFSIGEKAKEMPCHHQFHAKCILTWLEKTNSCPFCRHELPTDDEAYEAYKKDKKRKEQRKEDIEALHNSMFS